jgi:hypothetical protein
MNTCNGVCSKYISTRTKDRLNYGYNRKRCSICEIFITWEGIRCPCCSTRLRNKPKNRLAKQRLDSLNQ